MVWNQELASEVAIALRMNPHSVNQVLTLLKHEECTIPFIARYRKESIGGLDEVDIRHINDEYEEYVEREKRRKSVLDSLAKQNVLTPELEQAIKKCHTIQQIEELYSPYKSKKKTKALLARERGLQPFVDWMLSQQSSSDLANQLSWELVETKAKEFISEEKELPLVADVLMGAGDILVEKCSHHPSIREHLRESYWDHGLLASEKRPDSEKEKDYLKFKDFFQFQCSLKSLRPAKAGHRFLAMRRGQKLKILRLEVVPMPDVALQIMIRHVFPYFSQMKNEIKDFFHKCMERAYQFYLHPSLDLECKSELKYLADLSAVDVFGKNLRHLLLAPYLGPHTVMGIDPGVKTGLKLVVIDHTGKLLMDQVVYPFAPHNDLIGAKQVIEILLSHYQVHYVAIGNGTFGRETLRFLKEQITPIQEKKIQVTLISEAGASVYSASDLAREEFPDKDVVVRGAVSIARRFQDPLAELVKIDPKSIGVGQYQHDVHQGLLKKHLDQVVESCVNHVGVDLNTASAHLLSHISGISPTLGQNIVHYREEKGSFRSRQDLLQIPKMTPKIFQQSAGFLRIYKGDHPLDGTFVHPERYERLEQWGKEHDCSLQNLTHDGPKLEELSQDPVLLQEIGELTLKDIVTSLKAPAQDPRKQFESVDFTQGISSLNDIQVNQKLKGVVTNLTLFGAFVDVGIKEQGLIHISELSSRFVQDTFQELSVGQELEVRVLQVDLERKRLSLSCRPQEAIIPSTTMKTPSNPRPRSTSYEQHETKAYNAHHERPATKHTSDQRQEHRPDRVKNPPRHEQRPVINKDHTPHKAASSPAKKSRSPQKLVNRPFAILKDLKLGDS